MKSYMTPEPVEIKGAELPKNFDVAEALNTAGFAEFLSEFDDAETFDTGNTEEVESRFKAFSNKEKAGRNMAEFFQKELASQKLDIKFESKELQALVGERIEAMASEDPKKLNEIVDAMDEFATIQDDIAKAEARLKKLGDWSDIGKNLIALTEKEIVLTRAQEAAGSIDRKILGLAALAEGVFYGKKVQEAWKWLKDNPKEKDEPGKSKDALRAEKRAYIDKHTENRDLNRAVKSVKNDYAVEINPEAIAAALEETRAQIAELNKFGEIEQAASDIKAHYADIKNLLAGTLGMNEELKQLAAKKVEQKLSVLMDKDPEKAIAFLEDVKAADKGKNSIGIDYLGDDAAELGEMLQDKVEQTVVADLKSTIEKTKLGPKAFERLVGSLKKFAEKDAIGTKQGNEARAFIKETLEGIAREMSASMITPEAKAKGVLVRFALAKLAA